MEPFVNISTYKFTDLTDLKELRAELLASCEAWNLKGTILLSTEGINLFVAGHAARIDSLLTRLRAIPGLEDLTPKISHSDHQPFRRMLVRIKKEIIAFGVEGISPGRRTSPKLPPATLKQWLDEGRPVTLLDTRNDYEVKLGTFENALPIGINHFRDFPAAVRQLPPEMKDQPIVMFCTGGIRCEKAGPFMEREGFPQVFQLDGGILKYFEECGSAHYQGECFVFDQRVGVDPALAETKSAVCFVCQATLTPREQTDERYVVGVSCPQCHRSEREETQDLVTRRQFALDAVRSPAPGSVPYENRRPVTIPASCEGGDLLSALVLIFPQIPRGEWEARLAGGRFVRENGTVVAASQNVRAGERYWQIMPMASEPDVNTAVRILHEDQALVVVEKPAPLPMHPCGRYHKNTLQFLLHAAYAPLRPHPAHRLDADVTGLVVCARTRHYARGLHEQFEAGNVAKSYLAKVAGHPEWDRHECDARISADTSSMGTRTITENGKESVTEFVVLERCSDATSLLEVIPKTGRTHQIRLHLAHLGHPIVGETAYGEEVDDSKTFTRLPEDPPLCLHAWKISITHPLTAQRVDFQATMPNWAQTLDDLGRVEFRSRC